MWWVFVAMYGLLIAWLLLLLNTGSVLVALRLSWSAACGIFPEQGSNPRPLCWQADSSPLRLQGSPLTRILKIRFYKSFV